MSQTVEQESLKIVLMCDHGELIEMGLRSTKHVDIQIILFDARTRHAKSRSIRIQL